MIKAEQHLSNPDTNRPDHAVVQRKPTFALALFDFGVTFIS
jgi:hypothetical protein